MLTHDICKSGPLSYYRCPQDNGRLTPFFQFLREKQFLRVLTAAELASVRVKQLQCSNCGAPIDLERSTARFDPDLIRRLIGRQTHRAVP